MARVSILDAERGRVRDILHQMVRMFFRHGLFAILVGVVVLPAGVLVQYLKRDDLSATGLPPVLFGWDVMAFLSGWGLMMELLALFLAFVGYVVVVARMNLAATSEDTRVLTPIVRVVMQLPRILFVFSLVGIVIFLLFTFGSGVAEFGRAYAQAVLILLLSAGAWFSVTFLPLTGVLAMKPRLSWGSEFREASALSRRRRFSLTLSGLLVLAMVLALYQVQDMVWQRYDAVTALSGLLVSKILMFWLVASFLGAVYYEMTGSMPVPSQRRSVRLAFE